MKIDIARKIIILSFLTVLLSCEGIPVNSSTSQSWLVAQNAPEEIWATMTLLGVQVDMTSSRDSIERETAALAPLHFWKHGCRVIPAAEKPDYAARIYLREREISRGWQTRKSLAVEVHIWTFEDALDNGASVYEQKLPAAVGRVVTVGEASFTSSQTTDLMLSRAINIAAKELAAHKERDNDA